ncbi:MAG: phosphoglucosamine mutase [Alphaproteobacteria bacterium]
MVKKYFGTDGIRGRANQGLMTTDMAMKLGAAAGSIFTRGPHRHMVIIGKDTRLSGYMLEPALTAGFISVGMDVILVGPMPTPAVAMLTKSLRADLGIMISASHNPYYDNGIKIFNPDGFKLSDQIELDIESRIDNYSDEYFAASQLLGKTKRLEDAQGRYIEYVKSTFPKRKTLAGLKIVIDCANGAAYHLGPIILWELGAEVISIGVNPNGFNINENCGSNYPQNLVQEVVKNKADLGIALDGDSDRVIIVDEKGKVIDGDQLMAAISKYHKELGTLNNSSIVATVMSNIGLERYLNSLKLHLIRSNVGDKHVMLKMQESGANIGGEQSGHIILSDYSTTGDGLIAALQILSVIVESQKPASEVLNLFEPFPQILKNVKFDKISPLENVNIQTLIKAKEEEIGDRGRILVRKSGTEQLIRIMAEGDDISFITNIVDEIVDNISNLIQS